MTKWSEEAKLSRKRIMLSKYGVENSSQLPGVAEKRLNSIVRKYGTTNYMLALGITETKETKKRTTCLERYGVDCVTKTSNHIKKSNESREKTCLAKYGVRTIHEVNEVKEKTKQTCLSKYGVENALMLPEVINKRNEVCMKKYGTKEVFEIQTIINPHKTSKPEQQVINMQIPNLVFVGRKGKEKIDMLPGSTRKFRYPDFKVMPFDKTQKVVEVFGNYVHGEEQTGKSENCHEAQVIQEYKNVGVECIVVWGSDIKKDTKQVRARLVEYSTIRNDYTPKVLDDNKSLNPNTVI